MAVSTDGVRRLCGALLGACVLTTGHSIELHARQSRLDVPVPVSPTRKQAAVRPGPPPALPDEAASLAPVTIEMQVSTGSGARRQVVTRTVDRVHVSAGPDREWLYQRNPTDRRRVAGFLVDHLQRVIVRYDESDLRNNFEVRGWLDVLTLGFDSSALEALRPTGERRSNHGLTCEVYGADRPEAALREVCWSRADLMPVQVNRSGSDGAPKVDVLVLTVSRTVQDALLGEPSKRFPGYRAIDFPDWLEGLDER